MFKKNSIIINVNTIISFFDSVASQEVFQNNDKNESWLWYKLQFIISFLNQNNTDVIDSITLHNLFNAEKHKTYFNENSQSIVKSNALSLDELINQEPILNSLSAILVSSWNSFEYSFEKNNSIESFTKKHFFSIVNFVTLSFISIGLFSLWNFFNWNLIVFVLTLISSLFFYSKIKSFFTKIKNHQQEKIISKKIHSIQNKTETKESNIVSLIQNIGLEPWSNDPEINTKLKMFKNKTLNFISIYKNNSTNNPQMILDVEKMWRDHIPLFISKLEYNTNDKALILKTIQSMENVLQKHIEELFWNESIDISAKQRYWLMKATEKNI
jgi:hypothetical protein